MSTYFTIIGVFIYIISYKLTGSQQINDDDFRITLLIVICLSMVVLTRMFYGFLKRITLLCRRVNIEQHDIP